jgi:hypothetical protein
MESGWLAEKGRTTASFVEQETITDRGLKISQIELQNIKPLRVFCVPP